MDLFREIDLLSLEIAKFKRRMGEMSDGSMTNESEEIYVGYLSG
nr:hypothetical protein [Prochlorococcus marinus]